MAASLLEAAALSFFALYHSSLKRPPLFIHFHISNPNPPVSHNLPLFPLTKNHPRTKIFCFRSCSTAQEVTVETTPEETQEANLKRNLFVANLPWSFSVVWKVRGSHLREFISTNFNPISSEVVFDSPTGRSCGYGSVSFATKEEAEASISSLNGKMWFLLVREVQCHRDPSQHRQIFFAGSLMTRSTSRKVEEVVSFSNSVLQFKIEHRSPIC